jgi:DNA-binding transcriptional MerR regulator
MRISALSAASAVPVPTIKFYLREGLLHPGEQTSPTQARYDRSHVERLRLVRALVEVGALSLARVREVLAQLDDPPPSRHDLLGLAASAARLPGDRSDGDPGADAQADEPLRARELVGRLGWQVHGDGPAMRHLDRALRALDEVGLAPDDVHLSAYGSAALQVAEVDVASVPTTSAEAAVRYVVLGSVLYDPVLLALRRLAQQEVSRERFSRAPADAPPPRAERPARGARAPRGRG